MAQSDNDDIISLIEDNSGNTKISETLPLVPIRDIVVFTDMLLPIIISRGKSTRAIENAMSKDGILFLSSQKDSTIEEPKPDDIYSTGTVVQVLKAFRLPDGSFKALVQGIKKAKIQSYIKTKSFYLVKIAIIEELIQNDQENQEYKKYQEYQKERKKQKEQDLKFTGLEIEALIKNAKEFSEKILQLRDESNNEFMSVLNSMTDPGQLANFIASNLRFKTEQAQVLLECVDPIERIKKVNEMLSKELKLSEVQARIQSNVNNEISKNQKDYYLREQVRAIYKELGDCDEKLEEIDNYNKKIKQAKMPKEVHKEALKQLKRIEQMHPDAAESPLIKTYLDWLIEMPWNKATKDIFDIKRSQNILNKDHFGLEKIKDRILEYLSVKKLNPNMKGPIICFVGPPGVGKTSLGRSIAKSLNRKFVRISLGGLRDEAEIRGHRRTYIGSMPGRIIQGIKQVGTNNPVFMMDEIDKIGSDFRGDPSAALLEILDPEQNYQFSDHYLNVAFDLSKVIFILTANCTDSIPLALIDRMEIIQISGYTEEEKEQIALKYLIPRQIKENGLKNNNIAIGRDALKSLITEYTSESGLRNLEREIGSLCRKVARKIAEIQDTQKDTKNIKDIKDKFLINKQNLHDYLGPEKFLPEMDQEDSQVGLATGLAWTQTGGEVLYVEVSLISGKGELIITGQIGEVMQESARAAVSYAKANLAKFGVEENFFENLDIHVHVPAGAIPKDGPSAGTAIATALISILSKKPINKYIAMTGEITIRGRVLPIGGLKEKTLGALRGGIKTIILPDKNKKDLEEIPENVKEKINFVFVKSMDEVLDKAFQI